VVVVQKVLYRDNNDHPKNKQRRLHQVTKKRTKQISHESTSSFFTHATTTSSNYVGEEHVVLNNNHLHPPRRMTLQSQLPSPQEVTFSKPEELTTTPHSTAIAPLPDVPEGDHESEASSEAVTPIQIVFTFLQLLQHGNVSAAAQMLDDAVQVSYLGQPFCGSAVTWAVRQRQQGRSRNQKKGVWQPLQPGVHEHQVIRKGCLANGVPVVEVFELHHAPWAPQDHNETLCIGAMYQRRAPKQWIMGLLGRRRQK